ncbi:MAG TPA: hypothetical protein VK464_03560 [Symbiobacteriaceae bacterium]|nr:hypothetical protein [Symbiobacteriaceae bacterium]
MHTQKRPPMAGGSDRHEVICIEAKRVCDFCFQEHRVERTFPNVVVPAGAMVMCAVDEQNIVCREVERRPVEGTTNKVLVCVAVTVPVTITAGATTTPQTVTFLKQAVLCAPEGTDIECQVTGNCCCFFNPTTMELNCVFDFCVVIQTKVTVRILIQSLGMCAPKECRAVSCGPQQVAGVQPCSNCGEITSDSSGSGRC